MCLIAFALGVRDDLPLVLAANRDEAHARKTAVLSKWQDSDRTVIGGRDLESGGSWLLATSNGRLAAVTNHRRFPVVKHPLSRGWLVRDFVTGTESADEYVHRKEKEGYASFNLLVFDGREMWQLEDDRPPMRIAPGIHALSNARLDDPWPKVIRAKAALEKAIAFERHPMSDALFHALADRTYARDEELPDTGVGVELERVLSPPFIVAPVYGTRSSSVVSFGETDLTFEERSFSSAGEMTQRIELKVPVRRS